MTGYIESDESLFRRNFKKILNIAKMSEVSSVSITGKGEPMLNIPMVIEVAEVFSEFPVEIQTNGILLAKDPNLLNELWKAGLDIIAISIDNIKQFEELKNVTKHAHDLGMTVRYTVNVTDQLPKYSFKKYVDIMKKYNIDQFSFRQITTANFTEESEVHTWIKEHAENDRYSDLIFQFKNFNYRHLRDLPYGAKLYDVEGMSFTYFDYCVQDNSNEDNIRSLIFMEDGHVYTSWNSSASKLF